MSVCFFFVKDRSEAIFFIRVQCMILGLIVR